MNLQSAVQLLQAGRFAEAEAACRAFLRGAPEHPGALCLRGICLAELGETVKAIASLEKAAASAPAFADAHNNLGLLYMKTGRLAEAERCFREVIALSPPSAPAYANLGIVLAQAGRFDDAIAPFQAAVQLNPSEALLQKMLGDTLHSAGREQEAIRHHDAAIQHWQGEPDATFFEHMWRVYTALGQRDSARAVLDKWLASDSSNSIALHCLAASGGASAPTRASDGYVQGTFDAFAATFDEQLAAVGYRGPALIEQALGRITPKPVLSVLDAGCGTGLCGSILRPLTKQLVGVDLSSKMLERAQALGIYDALIAAELTTYLESQAQSFDWIVSADTFCYFGDLTALARASIMALRPGGSLVFTVERGDSKGPANSFTLLPQGRYCHGTAYVEAVLRDAGFAQVHIEQESLRKEKDDWIAGLVVTTQVPHLK